MLGKAWFYEKTQGAKTYLVIMELRFPANVYELLLVAISICDHGSPLLTAIVAQVLVVTR